MRNFYFSDPPDYLIIMRTIHHPHLVCSLSYYFYSLSKKTVRYWFYDVCLLTSKFWLLWMTLYQCDIGSGLFDFQCGVFFLIFQFCEAALGSSRGQFLAVDPVKWAILCPRAESLQLETHGLLFASYANLFAECNLVR